MYVENNDVYKQVTFENHRTKNREQRKECREALLKTILSKYRQTKV